MFVEFVIQNQLLSFTLEEFGQILGIPFRGQCFFSDKWSLDHLESSVPTGGPYQTNHPSPDENNLYVQEEQEDVVTRIRHDKVIDVEENQILTRRPSTSTLSSSAFRRPSSSHHIDDDNDGNGEGTSRASTPSPTHFVNSLSNNIPQ
ncbi:hypothetical protein Tco_1487556, partial [Tanacetum coccineum]